MSGKTEYNINFWVEPAIRESQHDVMLDDTISRIRRMVNEGYCQGEVCFYDSDTDTLHEGGWMIKEVK